jgi:hypothetical protein
LFSSGLKQSRRIPLSNPNIFHSNYLRLAAY